MTDPSDTLIVWHRWFPPRGDKEERNAIGGWKRHVTGRFQVSGGTVLGAMGGSAAAAFEPSDLLDVLTMALELLDEAEAHQPAMHVVIGAAVGPLDEMMMGPAIERAENLAIRAKPGELVLDHRARELAADHFLLGRQVSAGAGSARGTTVDRVFPRRAEAAKSLAQLGPPVLPPIIESTKAALVETLRDPAKRSIILRGPVGAGASELLSHLAEECGGPRIITLGAAPGGVVPLASLRLGLQLRIGDEGAVHENFAPIDEDAAAVVGRVAAGELVPLEELADAMRKLFAPRVPRPWVVLSPLGLVDGASLAALLRAREVGAEFVLFARYPIEPELPRPLANLEEPIHEVILPALKTSDAKSVAQAVLGEGTHDEVALRVAVLGGDTVIGVVEAARTSIANGDLVHDGEGFVWRNEPREGVDAVATEMLMSERLALVNADARGVLEAMCVAPDGSSRELIAKIAAAGNLEAAAFARGLDDLRREALAQGVSHPRPASSLMRWRVMSSMTPARSTELHRQVGEALRNETLEHPPQHAELAYYLVEGGRIDEGRPMVAKAVEAVLAAGYERAARQLSAWLAAVGETDSDGKRTAVAASLDEHEEGPPSTEVALEELLEDPRPAARALTQKIDDDAPAPAPIPSRKAAPPPPPPARIGGTRTIPRGHTSPRAIPKGIKSGRGTTPLTGETRSLSSDGSPLPHEPPRSKDADDVAVAPVTPESPRRRPPPPPDERTSLASPIKRPPPPPPDALAARDRPADGDDDSLTTKKKRPPPPPPGMIPPRRAGAASTPATPPVAPHDDLDERPTQKSDVLAVDQKLDDLLTNDLAFFHESGSSAPPESRPFVADAVAAIRRRDFRALEAAIAREEGAAASPSAIARLRAVADLAKGDFASARKRLSETVPSDGASAAAQARHQLAMALLNLRDGSPVPGVRAGLAALAASRGAEDTRGEAAALQMIAACYRAIGRHEDANRLESLV